MSDLEVVAFERRGRLGFGALKGGGEKNARLVDDEGETLKVSQEKLLHRFKARVPDGDARVVKEKLRALAKDLGGRIKQAVDLDLLWGSLEEEKVYHLHELAELYFGDATDAGVAALVQALSGEGSDEPPYHFRLKPGGLARTDEETFTKIKERLEGERRRREREAAFRAWFDEGARTARKDEKAKPFATPPADLAEHLQVLVDYALAGDKSHQVSRARRLAADLHLADPDEALALLERGGALPKDANELPHRAGVPIVFTHRVREEAEALTAAKPDLSGRFDFRGKPTTAIDDITTQDVDDGFSLWEEDGALWLAIHIADVSSTIAKESELDHEAKKRATTIYFPGQTIPMLPPALMRARLSLDPEQDRPTVSWIGKLGDGPISGRFVRGLIRVDRRLTYDVTHDPPEEWRDALKKLEPFAARLRRERIEAGAVQLELPDLKIEIEADGEPSVKLTSSDTPGHRLVSELMVLYNRELGRALREARLAAAFRVQREPVTPPTIAPDDPLYVIRARRGLPPTVIDVDPGPHNTLGVDTYVQGSSPIRRFGDLLAQRQLVSSIEGKPPAYTKDEVRAVLMDLERSEKGARRLEAERDLYWIARWFEPRRGEVFEGVVARSPAEGRGLVYVRAVHLELPLGERDDTGEPVAEGALVRIKVKRCSPRRRSVTFELAPS
jgi:exoribonuclease-2